MSAMTESCSRAGTDGDRTRWPPLRQGARMTMRYGDAARTGVMRPEPLAGE